jgi:hypothetical protein
MAWWECTVAVRYGVCYVGVGTDGLPVGSKDRERILKDNTGRALFDIQVGGCTLKKKISDAS